MKKLFILIVLLGWCLIGYGQRITQLNEATEAEGESLIMVRQGTTGNLLSKITKTNFLGNIEADSLILINSGADVMFREGSDTLNPYIPVANRTDIFDVAARKYLTDTLLVTDANYTLVLADDGRYIRTSHATSVAVLVPANATVAFPVGTVINFVSTLGAIDFNAAAGVTLNSELDSVNVAHKGGAATLVKRATNKWDLFGSLLN